MGSVYIKAASVFEDCPNTVMEESDDTLFFRRAPYVESDLATSAHSYVRKRTGKVDRISGLSFFAVRKLEKLFCNYRKDRVGIFVGNMLGGWEFAEEQLKNLYSLGPNRVSAFQATAWFPAAIQGELSIAYGITGFSKTLSGGSLCSLEALAIAIDAIKLSKVDIALVGAVEAYSPSIAQAAFNKPEKGVLRDCACFLVLTSERIGRSPWLVSVHQESGPRVLKSYSGYSTKSDELSAWSEYENPVLKVIRELKTFQKSVNGTQTSLRFSEASRRFLVDLSWTGRST